MIRSSSGSGWNGWPAKNPFCKIEYLGIDEERGDWMNGKIVAYLAWWRWTFSSTLQMNILLLLPIVIHRQEKRRERKSPTREAQSFDKSIRSLTVCSINIRWEEERRRWREKGSTWRRRRRTDWWVGWLYQIRLMEKKDRGKVPIRCGIKSRRSAREEESSWWSNSALKFLEHPFVDGSKEGNTRRRWV